MRAADAPSQTSTAYSPSAVANSAVTGTTSVSGRSSSSRITIRTPIGPASATCVWSSNSTVAVGGVTASPSPVGSPPGSTAASSASIDAPSGSVTAIGVPTASVRAWAAVSLAVARSVVEV